jgi:D-aminoacyl-tRNA deacylase
VRALVTRVSEASVTSAPERDAPHELVGRIGPGLLALVGVTHEDTEEQARRLAEKLWHLRVFPDDADTMNVSCADAGGEVLVVSQFTLYGDTGKGRRPSYLAAAPPEHAEPLIDVLCEHLRHLGARVAAGRFRTHMAVASVNDGPVTLVLET